MSDWLNSGEWEQAWIAVAGLSVFDRSFLLRKARNVKHRAGGDAGGVWNGRARLEDGTRVQRLTWHTGCVEINLDVFRDAGYEVVSREWKRSAVVGT